MRRLVSNLFTRLPRRLGKSITTASTEPNLDAEHRVAARRLAEAIDRAMEMGLWEHAERLAQGSQRLVASSPILAERFARLRLAQGKPAEALRIIDDMDDLADSSRLLRATCLVLLGRRIEAHGDLLRWAKKSTAPLDARIMLALLEWDTGDSHAASTALLRNLRYLEDPRSLELLILLAVQEGRTEQAATWARRLRQSTSLGRSSPYATIMCCSLLLPVSRERSMPTPEQITLLSKELAAAEHVIPALVDAQQLRPDDNLALMLYQSIEQALGDLVDELRAIESLARLSVLLGNRNTARMWVERGLAINPMSATLTMIMRGLGNAADQPDEPTRPDVLAVIGTPPPEAPDSPPMGKAA